MLTIKDRIEMLCKEKGVQSLNALEKEVGLGSGTILKWDRQNPRIDKVQKVADYFNCPVDYLLGRNIDYEYRDSIAEDLARNPEFKGFMDMARNCSADELNILKGMIKSWKKS